MLVRVLSVPWPVASLKTDALPHHGDALLGQKAKQLALTKLRVTLQRIIKMIN